MIYKQELHLQQFTENMTVVERWWEILQSF